MAKFFQEQLGDPEVSSICPPHLSLCLGILRDRRITRNGTLRPLAPATLNKHTQFLRRILTHASALGEQIQHFHWKAFLAIEGEQPIRPLTLEEEARALQGMDDYIRPLFQFSVLTGVRLSNAYQLKWDQVDYEAGTITFRGKSRLPGGKTYVIPLTGLVRSLLETERHHPEFVFTFISRRTNRWGYVAGHRYPLTKPIIRDYWERLGLDKRWHDVRHTFGTRLYRDTKDVHLVQRAMNHSDIATTMRYVHTDLTDVAEAMDKMNNRSSIRQEIWEKEQKRTAENRKGIKLVRSEGLEPPRCYSLPPQGSASTNSATSA